MLLECDHSFLQGRSKVTFITLNSGMGEAICLFIWILSGAVNRHKSHKREDSGLKGQWLDFTGSLRVVASGGTSTYATVKGVQLGGRDFRDTLHMNIANVMCQENRISGPEVTSMTGRLLMVAVVL